MKKDAAEILKMLSEHQTAASPKALAEFIGDEAELFAEVVRIFLKEHHRRAQGASNVFMVVAEKRPELFGPHLGKLIRESARKNAPPVIRRNVHRLLQKIDVPKKLRAVVFSHCVELVDDPDEETAARAFAMTAAARIGLAEPALFNELVLIVQKYLPYEKSPSYRRRAMKILQGEFFK